jgi:hypothetical protein
MVAAVEGPARTVKVIGSVVPAACLCVSDSGIMLFANAFGAFTTANPDVVCVL